MYLTTFVFSALFGCFSYILWLVVYRLVYHPLARFPGPKIAAATKWYEAYFDLIKRPGGQFMVEIDRMHEKYGPIVRINPDELHVKDSEWVEVLYSNPIHGVRDKYAPAAMMTGTPNGIFGTIKHDVHRKRRAAINAMFSKKSINEVEPMIHEMVARLCKRLSQVAASKEEIEMRGLYLAVTTDVVCQHVLQSNLGLLQSTQRAHDWKRTIGAVAILTPLAKQFTWIIPMALKLPTALLRITVPALGRIVQLHRDMHTEARAAIETSGFSRDSESYESRWQTDARSKSQHSTIFENCLQSHHLSADEKKMQRLAQEAFTIIVAGGETTARVLATATFHIMANKERVVPRLLDELRLVMADPSDIMSLKSAEQLPWLTAIIKESLRITALVTSRLPLVAPQDCLQYKDWVIPAGTPISMTLRDVLLDERVFSNPHEFQPERWLSSNPDIARISRFYLPFGRGSRMCIGLNLALAELYLILGTVFRRFDLELFETTKERDIDIARDCFIGEPSKQSKGVRSRVSVI